MKCRLRNFNSLIATLFHSSFVRKIYFTAKIFSERSHTQKIKSLLNYLWSLNHVLPHFCGWQVFIKSIYLVFFSLEMQGRQRQSKVCYNIFNSVWKETTYKPSKVVAAKNFFLQCLLLLVQLASMSVFYRMS